MHTRYMCTCWRHERKTASPLLATSYGVIGCRAVGRHSNRNRNWNIILPFKWTTTCGWGRALRRLKLGTVALTTFTASEAWARNWRLYTYRYSRGPSHSLTRRLSMSNPQAEELDSFRALLAGASKLGSGFIGLTAIPEVSSPQNQHVSAQWRPPLMEVLGTNNCVYIEVPAGADSPSGGQDFPQGCIRKLS